MISACSAGAPCASFCSSCRSSVKTATETAFLSTTGAGGRGSRSRIPKSVVQAARSVATTAPPAVSFDFIALIRALRDMTPSSGMRLRFMLGVDRPARHTDTEMRAGKFAVHDLHGAAVRGDEFEHDGQPDPGAFDRRAFGGPSSVESFEHVRAVFHWNTRPAVSDIQLQQLTSGARPQVDSTPLGRILHRVGHQVLQNEPNLAAIRDERHIFDAHIEAHALRQQRELLVLQHLLDNRPQAELRGLEPDARGLPGTE